MSVRSFVKALKHKKTRQPKPSPPDLNLADGYPYRNLYESIFGKSQETMSETMSGATISIEVPVERMYQYGKQRCESLGINTAAPVGQKIFEFAIRKRLEAASQDNPYLAITAWLEAIAVETFWDETQRRFGVTGYDAPGTRVRCFGGETATLVGAVPGNPLFAAVVVDNEFSNAGLRGEPFSELRLEVDREEGEDNNE